ncbi:NUDIX hydrolase [Fulvivirgaceae bacterium BMA10]|uniref:NUDIX hydrolase n=1 Tax=Splendidivirga corallicola TaxID=3051826 RepID=A0ABT8KM55_9BACT|nr:NUDIX hydrolase [Fulvivirgaceae bacterium BMA10]
MNYKCLELAKRIQALAQNGLTYTEGEFDRERYEELRSISVELMHEFSHAEIPLIKELFANQTGYQTPMVDVRAVVFKDRKILMVKEKIDGCWALPGGWADVGYTPSEVAVKEVKEEAGLEVKAERVLAILDKKCHPHPPQPFYVYKIFILCEIIGGESTTGIETLDVDFFSLEDLPELSKDRNIQSQIELMFDFLHSPDKRVVID